MGDQEPPPQRARELISLFIQKIRLRISQPYFIFMPLHPTLYTLHFTPYTLHFTLYTLHPTPYTFSKLCATLALGPYESPFVCSQNKVSMADVEYSLSYPFLLVQSLFR